MSRRYRIGIGLLLLSSATTSFARTEIWFGPHPTSIDFYTSFEPGRYDEWRALSYSVDVFKFYLSLITTDDNYAQQPQSMNYTHAQLRQAAVMLNQFGIKAAFEFGGPIGNCQTGNPQTVGWEAANAQANTLQAYVDNYRQATGRSDDGVYAITIDGPVEATHHDGRDKSCTFSNEQSLQAYASYVAELRNRFPQARIGVITNFANMRYDGKTVRNGTYLRNWDYRDVLNQLVARANAVGVAIDFLQIDHPADLVVDINSTNRGNWGQLRDLATQARSLGLRVNVVFNADNGQHWDDVPPTTPFPHLTQTSNKYSPPAPITQAVRDQNRLYATRTLAYATRWRDELLPIDTATFQTWHNYPYSVFQSSAPQIHPDDDFAAANIVNAVNTTFNRNICSPYEYKSQRADLDAYLSQFSGAALYAYASYHWDNDGAFELIGAPGDPFALHTRLDQNGNPVTPTMLSLCRTTPPNTCTEAEYFRRRPDVGAAYRAPKLSAMHHWQIHGQNEGMCQPSRPQENCSVASYFMQRPDVQANSGGNSGFAGTHWNSWGRWEGMCKPF